MGGANNDGTLLRITTSGALTTLYSFAGYDGTNPVGALVKGADGSLYGTTQTGGVYNTGEIFKITLAGTLTVVTSFFSSVGMQPCAALIQATDGNLYGTLAVGGPGGYGSVFRLNPEPTLMYSEPTQAVIHGFTSIDGAGPFGGLVQGADGNLYGVTSAGGANGNGVVFSLDVMAPAMSVATASAITGSNATLSISVNPNGRDTHVWFAHSTSNTMSGNTPTNMQDIGSGKNKVAVSANVSGLTPNTRYYFSATASNTGGESMTRWGVSPPRPPRSLMPFREP